MYRRADLWRTLVLVVALLLAAVSTGAFAREFCASDPQFGRHPIDTLHSGQLGAETGALEHIRTGGRLRGVERI